MILGPDSVTRFSFDFLLTQSSTRCRAILNSKTSDIIFTMNIGIFCWWKGAVFAAKRIMYFFSLHFT